MRSPPLPPHEAFNRLVLREAELVVLLSGVAVAVLGAFPELALVAAGEQGLVLLTLMLEDRDALALYLVGREWHRHLDLVDAPFLPSAAVEPDFTGTHPVLILETVHRLEDRGEAHAVRAVGVGEVASGINLVRPD